VNLKVVIAVTVSDAYGRGHIWRVRPEIRMPEHASLCVLQK